MIKNKNLIILTMLGLLLSSFLISGASSMNVSIEDINAAPGSQQSVFIYIDSGLNGLINATIKLFFDPDTVKILYIGNSDFNMLNTDINDISGWALIEATDNSPGINGNYIKFANIIFQTVGMPGNVSGLNLSVISMINNSNDDLSASTIVTNGTYTITDYVDTPGSGGGGGGTAENNYNVECFENDRQYVYESQLTSFKYSYDCNIVKYLNFTGEATLGKILTKVEMLYNTSTLVALDPPGEVYRNFNVWTGFQGWFSSDHVSDPVLTFAVDKSWVINNNIDPGSISLFFYNVNKWDKVPTQKISEDSLTYYFKANLPITGT
ncbi:MAG: PGF-pre-PGF domain-containing protein, partial [ANME-2 cluster archaeon]